MPAALRVAVALCLGCCWPLSVDGAEVDSDGDGIPDAVEAVLGSDPHSADTLQVVLDRRAAAGSMPKDAAAASKHFLTVECGHAGGNRFLWRVTFPVAPQLKDTVLHLYVDADADPATGRAGPPGGATTGIDYMLSVVGDQGTSSRYDAQGKSGTGPRVSHAVVGNTVLLSTDIDVARDAAGAKFGLYVLCHTITSGGKKPATSVSSPRVAVTGVPITDRQKIVRPVDIEQNWQVAGTYGEKTLQAIEHAPDTLVVPHDALQLEKFAVDLQTSDRWPHVTRQGNQGRAWTTAPRAGRYHVGFMMYDDSSDSRVSIHVGAELAGLVVANQNNNRTWLYWTTKAYTFRGGETVELRAFGPSGKHGICNILFLPQPPAPRALEFRVENLTSATMVDRPGRVLVSWTTTWPSPTQFEFGHETAYGKTAKLDSPPSLVHRVVLDDLDPEATYHGRAVAADRDLQPYTSGDFTFHARPPRVPLTKAGVTRVPLTVQNPHDRKIDSWPVTTGVPFPQGVLGSPDQVRLLRGAAEVPAQVRLTGRWRDGSVKWLLITFLAAAPAAGQADYHLEFGADVRRAPPPQRNLAERQGDSVLLNTGRLSLKIDARGNIADVRRGSESLLAPSQTCETVLRDATGTSYTARQPAEVTIEEAGPLRAVVQVVADLADDNGHSPLRIEKRVEVYPDLAAVRVSHTLVVTAGEPFLRVKDLTFRVPVAETAWQLPIESGPAVELDQAHPAVRQRFDNELVTFTASGEGQAAKGRLVGAALARGPSPCAVVLRDCWQNYPKAFQTGSHGLELGLLPPIEPGLYDKFPFEKEGHHLYYYLLDGVYRLKVGQAKTDEFWLSFAPAAQSPLVAALVQRPLLATAAAEWFCGSRAFYDVAPRNADRFKLYEEAIDKNLAAYVAQREKTRDFGALNYGDWYPERGANWGNEEYDTQHAFFLEYVRSGNPAAFFLGDAHELHNRDVDTRHAASSADGIGAVYVHQMGHVGGFYDKSVPGTLGFPESGFTVSHAWCEGHFDHYFLTGDRRSYETGCLVADYFTRRGLGRPYDFLSCREPGWHLIMLAAAYAATNDPYYLNAARVVVGRVLETQDTQPRPLPAYQQAGRKPDQLGGWSRMLVPGHCTCEPRHRGNAGFMIAVLLSGLKYYHDVTGDEDVKRAIILGAYNLLDETYSDKVHGFRYTSCPNTRYVPGASPLMVEGIARAYLWTKDERFRRVLTEALPRGAGGSGYGKSFSMYYRCAPRVLSDLDAAGIRMDTPLKE